MRAALAARPPAAFAVAAERARTRRGATGELDHRAWRCASRRTRAPCGVCASCRLLRADSHPGFARGAPRGGCAADQGRSDARARSSRLTLKSYRGGYKVGVIEGAEALNANGANAFLKTLEEPTARHAADHDRAGPATACRRPSPAAVCACNLRPPPTRGGHRVARGARARRRESGMRRWRWPAVRRCWRWNWTPRASPRSTPRCARALRQLAADSVDVTLLAERWVKSDPGLRLTWLENWITRRVHAALGARHFASKCGTGPLACRFT